MASCAVAASGVTYALAQENGQTLKPEAAQKEAAQQGSVTILLKLAPSFPEVETPAKAIPEPAKEGGLPASTPLASGPGIASPAPGQADPSMKVSASQPRLKTAPVTQPPSAAFPWGLSPDPLSLGPVVSRRAGGILRGWPTDSPKASQSNEAQQEQTATPEPQSSFDWLQTGSELQLSGSSPVKSDSGDEIAANGVLVLSPEPAPGPTQEEMQAETAKAEGDQGECPGAPNRGVPIVESQADDIPLDQDEHPYDAPAARSSSESAAANRVIRDTSLADEELRAGINRCLHYFLTHPENVAQRGPWALMHATLPFGVEAEVLAGNRRVNAIGWMCYNGLCAKQRIFQPTRQGFRTNIGPGVQGHEGQFLAILAQSRVQADYPIMVGNRKYTIQDLVRYEMASCREKSELTFKLIGLSQYLHQEQKWRDTRGHTWNLEKMVAEELAQPVIGAACGGTHRLMGLSFALSRRHAAGLPIVGHWQRAEVFIHDYVNYAMSLQNPDGSFSTEWFEGRAHELDVERQVQTTGHILEWLLFTLPEAELQSPKIKQSVEFLIENIGGDPSRNWPIGPRGHALRAMALYNQRVFGAELGQLRQTVAESALRPTPR